MPGDHLKVTLRRIYREKLYALINILGLSLGIACCIILSLYLRDELTYDRHHLNHERIYRVANEFTINGKTDAFAITSPALGPMLADGYPEIQDYVRLRPMRQKWMFHYQDQSRYWEDVYVADDNVFEVFTHNILYGDPQTALTNPGSLAVSEEFARSFFGDADAVGKVVRDDSGEPLTITLVFANLPPNTHLKYDALLSYNGPPYETPQDTTTRRRMLTGINSYTYLVMSEGSPLKDYPEISSAFFDEHMAAMARNINATWRSWLQPLADIHLYSEVGGDLPTGNRLYLYGFAAVAIFILIVACINYMNLATARYAKRARDVGMRKILGAGRGSLMLEFFAEALSFSLIALALGILLAELTLGLTPLNALLDKSLDLNLNQSPELAAWLLGSGLSIGLLSGLYPALYLSSVMPLSALVANNRSAKSGIRLREFLVLIQLTISIGVIACTLLMAAQMRYVSDKSLGFNKENVLLVPLRGADLIAQVPTLRTELLKNTDILSIATSSSMMGKTFPTNVGQLENNEGTSEARAINHMPVSGEFFAVMGLQIVAGRDFSSRLLTDTGSSFVVNQALVDFMGWEQPLGKRVSLGANGGTVIGVVKDFHFESLHHQVKPFAFYPFADSFDTMAAPRRPFITRNLVVKVKGENILQTLAFLQRTFAEFDPKHPFEFEFLDESLNALYLAETRLMKLTGIFAAICIFISCLGLFGLAAFTTEQRRKEIGIRKVLGASTGQIILLLARNVLKLVLIGAAVATAISWLIMQEWLSGFAYHAGLTPLPFLLAAATATCVVYVTLALQSYKTAEANPVRALRQD